MSRRAVLSLLLSSTGLSQSEAARFLGVEERTVRRWLDGDRETPADAIEPLTALRDRIDKAAAEAIAMISGRRDPTALLIYLRDVDVPESAGLPSAACHRAMVRRVWESSPARTVPVAFDRDAYRAWLGKRGDGPQHRAAWAASVILE